MGSMSTDDVKKAPKSKKNVPSSKHSSDGAGLPKKTPFDGEVLLKTTPLNRKKPPLSSAHKSPKTLSSKHRLRSTSSVEIETAINSPPSTKHQSKLPSTGGIEAPDKNPRSSQRGGRKFSSSSLGLENIPLTATPGTITVSENFQFSSQ